MRRRDRRSSSNSSLASGSSSLSYQESHKGFELPPTASSFALPSSNGGDTCCPSLQLHPHWKRSISNDTRNSSIPEEECQPDQNSPCTMMTPATTSRYKPLQLATTAREDSLTCDVYPVAGIHVKMPELPHPCEEVIGKPKVPSSRRCSPMGLRTGTVCPTESVSESCFKSIAHFSADKSQRNLV